MRASNSRNAAARRTRFAESRAGVMSASRVNLGNPCSRAARAPINTNSTSCRASVLNKSSGSRGAPGSDTACPMQEVSDILDLLEALLGRHPQDSRDFVQHVRSHHHARLELGMDVEVRRREQTLERLPGRAGLALLDPRGDGAAREGALAETGTGTGLAEQCGGGSHAE